MAVKDRTTASPTTSNATRTTAAPDGQRTRLLAHTGGERIKQLLALPRTDELLALVRMGQFSPEETRYVFTSPKGGVHILFRRERLASHGRGLRVYRDTYAKLLLHPRDTFFWQKGSGLKRLSLGHFVSHYRANELVREHADAVYPFLKALLRDYHSSALGEGQLNQVSMHRVLGRKLYSVEKLARDRYPHLWMRNIKSYHHIPMGMRPMTLDLPELNRIARLNPEINVWFDRTYGACAAARAGYIPADKLPSHDQLGLMADTYRVATAYGEKFSFTWSEKRIKDVHDKLYNRYTKAVADLDPSPLNLHPVYAGHDWEELAREETRIQGAQPLQLRLLTSSGELAVEGKRQNHCVAGYAQRVNAGGCCILSVEWGQSRYTAEVGVQWKKAKNYKNDRVAVVNEPGARDLAPTPDVWCQSQPPKPSQIGPEGWVPALQLLQLRGYANALPDPKATQAMTFLLERLNLFSGDQLIGLARAHFTPGEPGGVEMPLEMGMMMMGEAQPVDLPF